MKRLLTVLIFVILFCYSGFGIDYYLEFVPNFDADSNYSISLDYSKSNTFQFKSSDFLFALEEESESEKEIIFNAGISNLTCYTILIKSVYPPLKTHFINVILFESDSSPPINC